MAETVQEFFQNLESRADSSKTAGMTSSYVFEIAGAGEWKVDVDDGKVTVTDGPFAETKELIASYALLETKSRAEAIEWTTRFLKVLGEGECEVRPLYEPGDFGEAVPERPSQ